jgi:hypothetical protein
MLIQNFLSVRAFNGGGGGGDDDDHDILGLSKK